MTPVSVIYEKFLNSIDDIELSLLDGEDIQYLLLDYLENSTVSFHECEKSLKIIEGEYIEGDLSLEEIYILALGMTAHWLSPKIKREENLRQMMNDRDYKQLSNASMLNRLLNLDDSIKKEIRSYKQRYAFKKFKGFD